MEIAPYPPYVAATDVALAQAVRRLVRAQVAAILGVRYDDRAYDRIILAHRRARVAAAAARRDWLGGLPARAGAA